MLFIVLPSGSGFSQHQPASLHQPPINGFSVPPPAAAPPPTEAPPPAADPPPAPESAEPPPPLLPPPGASGFWPRSTRGVHAMRDRRPTHSVRALMAFQLPP